MAKVSKIMKLSFCEAQYSIEYHYGKVNPFRVYEHGYKPDPYDGGMRYKKTKIMIDKYANLDSAMLCIVSQRRYRFAAYKD